MLPGPVRSLTDYFDVPKGDHDVRMVYNGSSCGLNEALWAPSFWLPTADTALRAMTFGTYCVDLDLGEMFLNFPLDKALQPYAGIDLTPIQHLLADFDGSGRAPTQTLWERWVRNFMGLKTSPINTLTHYYLAEELVRGPPQDPRSPLHYDQVDMNLPGMPNYDPTRPR